MYEKITGYKDRYVASSAGNIYSLYGILPKKLSPHQDDAGYCSVNLNVDGQQFHRKVHRLVYEAFSGEIPEGYHIHHIDGDTSNNELDNLEAIDPSTHARLHNRGRGRKIAQLRCPICKRIFERAFNKTSWGKGEDRPTSCSRSCGGKMSCNDIRYSKSENLLKIFYH